MAKKKKVNESNEALMRIPVGIVSGIIFGLGLYVIYALIVINFFYTLFSGKRLREVSEAAEVWNTNAYEFMKYITFVDNERPFPFKELRKNISKFK
jgi:hypothetical protein